MAKKYPDGQWQECREGAERNYCEAYCATRGGVKSCWVWVTFPPRIREVKVLPVRPEKRGVPTCSCNDPEEPECHNDNPPIKIPPAPKWLPYLIIPFILIPILI